MDKQVLDGLWNDGTAVDFDAFIEAHIGFTLDAETGQRKPACLGSGDGQKWCWRCIYWRYC